MLPYDYTYKTIITRIAQPQYRNLFKNKNVHTALLLYNDNKENHQYFLLYTLVYTQFL